MGCLLAGPGKDSDMIAKIGHSRIKLVGMTLRSLSARLCQTMLRCWPPAESLYSCHANHSPI